ncbi:MAG: hypothetical protein CVT81_05145 [Alphaproteobacteria bacterium HGW-Alphaproteobacteria-3]|nr:MAG: hypothetical protein CVT81_05145 [Alphaproteobacteria bacterium HGW-Alphaproteobacteria-3]
MVFGVMEQEGSDTILRDWELLQLLNSLTLRTQTGSPRVVNCNEVVAVVERLTRFIGPDLANRAPSMARPMAWPELLLLPEGYPKT